MGLLKRTYTLPAETLRQFEELVLAGKRSSLLSRLIQDWLERQRQARLRQEVIEGCKAMQDIYIEIEREYHPLEEEVQRAQYPRHRKGRRRARTPGSRRRL